MRSWIVVVVAALASAGVRVGAEPLASLERESRGLPASLAGVDERLAWEGGYWVEGQRRPRELWWEGGLVRLSGAFGGQNRTLFADPGRSRELLVASGGGARVTLRPGQAGELLARVEFEGRTEEEVWLPAGPAELSCYSLPAELRSGEGWELTLEVGGTPQDLALVVRAEAGSERYAEWDDLVHYRELGRLGPGSHAVSWDGLDRTLPRRALPPGRYRLSVEPVHTGLAPAEAPRLEVTFRVLP